MFESYNFRNSFFYLLGERLLATGYSTPFINVGSAYMYPSLEDAKEAIYNIGQKIKNNGLHSDLSPMSFVFTGTACIKYL